MKKELKNMILAAVAALACAFSFTSCSDVSVAEAADAENDSRSLVFWVRTISSDINPGYGKAVYFTGTFEDGKVWTVAHRGTYADGKWTYTFKTSCVSFEYKALVGDWDLGETVNAEFSTLRKLGEAGNLSGYQGMPSGIYHYDASDIQYGEAVYFKHPNSLYAVRGEYKEKYERDYSPVLYNSWIYNYSGVMPYSFYNADAYVGAYDLGEKVYPDFVNLEWESGENHVFPIQ